MIFCRKKTFSERRSEAKEFLVLRSHGMFGNFTNYWNDSVSISEYTKVIARTPKEAAYRFFRRTNTIMDISRWDGEPTETNEMFAKLKIVSPTYLNFKKFTYWK